MREKLVLMAMVTLGGALAFGCADNPTNCADSPCRQGATCVQLTYETFECRCPPGEGGDGIDFCAPMHTVTAADPSSGPLAGGETITITGTGFADPDAGETTVRFGTAVSGPATVVDDTTITVVLPPGATTGPVDLTVINALGEVTVENGFTYFGSWLYVNNGAGGIVGPDGSNLYRVNPITADYTVIAPIMLGATNVTTTALAFDEDGNLYGAESIQGPPYSSDTYGDGSGYARLFSIDAGTGAATDLGYLIDPVGPTSRHHVPDMTFLDGVLFAWVELPDQPATIDVSNAEVTPFGTPGAVNSYGSALAADDAGNIWFLNGTGSLLVVDPATGNVTAGPVVSGMVLDHADSMTFMDGILYAVDHVTGNKGGPTQPASLVRIDVATGQATTVGPLPAAVDSIASR